MGKGWENCEFIYYRCGMVYLAPQNLGYKPYFMRWLNIRNNKTEMKILKILFDKYVPATLEYPLFLLL
jgi:dynein heavy chain